MHLPPELAALEPLAERPRRAAFLVDFDGSLAPIVDDPSAARPLPSAVAALALLVPHLACVAVVSGRPVAFLADHLDVPGLSLVGLYGLERVTDGDLWRDPRALPYVPAIAAAADELAARLPDLLVERKGDLAVTVHWRRAPSRADDAITAALDVSAAHGLEAPMRGRLSMELRPPVPVDKGSVTAELVSGLHAAAFAGDDAGDVPAFAELARLHRGGDLGAGVSIGVRSAEAPDAVLRADVVVEGPAGLAALVAALADAVGA
ncbi:MAG: trehalose-phosphatase [Acidimicrobiia bacterium]